MSKGLLGRKVGMTQIFVDQGVAEPVTVVEAGPCVVSQIRTIERDGYAAVQLGYLDKPVRLSSRSHRGQLSRLDSRVGDAAGSDDVGRGLKRFYREFRGDCGSYALGQQLTVDQFAEGSRVDVIGVSKGRGFAGVIKRHNFSGVCASHGVKKVHRSGGSTGQSTDPGKVFKGTKMPGRYSARRVTIRNLKVCRSDVGGNLLLIRGAVPGCAGGCLVVRETNCF